MKLTTEDLLEVRSYLIQSLIDRLKYIDDLDEHENKEIELKEITQLIIIILKIRNKLNAKND